MEGGPLATVEARTIARVERFFPTAVYVDVSAGFVLVVDHVLIVEAVVVVVVVVVEEEAVEVGLQALLQEQLPSICPLLLHHPVDDTIVAVLVEERHMDSSFHRNRQIS